jgi:hypothetical protein
MDIKSEKKKWLDNFTPSTKAKILGLYIKHSNPYDDNTVRWWKEFDIFVSENKNYIKSVLRTYLYTEYEKIRHTEDYDKMDSILNEINNINKL